MAACIIFQCRNYLSTRGSRVSFSLQHAHFLTRKNYEEGIGAKKRFNAEYFDYVIYAFTTRRFFIAQTSRDAMR